MIHTRLGCSTISFRHLPLPQALATIAELGFAEIDLGALPGVCDHVPYVLDAAAVADVAATVAASGLRVRSINGDIGDLNAPLDPEARARPRQSSRHAGRARGGDRVACAGAALRRARPHPDRHTRCRPRPRRGRARRRRRHRCRPRRGAVGRIAALPPVVLQHRTRSTTYEPPRPGGRPGRRGDGFQPHHRVRRRPGGVRRPLRPAHRACPHPRRGAGQHQPVGRQRRRWTSPAVSRRWPTPATTATSRSNSKPATSPTTNGPRQPPSRSTDFRPHLAHIRRQHMSNTPTHRRHHRRHLRPRHRHDCRPALRPRGLGRGDARPRRGEVGEGRRRHRQPVRRSRVRPRRRRHLRRVGGRRPRGRRRARWPPATCRPSARWPTSPASPRRCRSWRPRWICGTW